MSESYSSPFRFITFRELPSSGLLEKVIRLQAQHIIAPQAVTATGGNSDVQESARGFLLKAYDVDTFRALFQMGGTLTVALDSNETVLGYVTGTPGTTFGPRHPETRVLWEDASPDSQSRSVFGSGKYRYLDQIAVDPSPSARGVARALVQDFLRESGHEPVFSAVVQHPVENLRSTQFFIRQGFMAAAQLRTPKLGNLEDVRAILFWRAGQSAL